jgi:hypothetical protein
MLDRASILSANDRPVKKVEVQEWGGEIGIKCLSYADAMRLRDKYQGDEKKTSESLAETIILSVCDDGGNLLFTADDLPALQLKNYSILLRLAEKINEVNGFNEEVRKELEKN